MMTLAQWEANNWLQREPTSKNEISNLLAIVERDMIDATSSISPDWQFGIAYNAALKLCTVLLRAEEYRPNHGLQHYRSIIAMPLILGASKNEDASYLDSCRIKRNSIEYDCVGGASQNDADELLEYVNELKKNVIDWLTQHHADLLEGF